MYFGWKPYVPVAERRRKAQREAAKLRKNDGALAPIVATGRTIAQTFWGKAWCENLERYGDYANRLPRGRTYVRNGSVIDLKVAAGEITALVSGSSLYKVSAQVAALEPSRWQAICSDCAGAVDSLVELLQAKLSKGVMERMCRRETGLFPSPKEIRFSCSCPDWANMCKHVAAVLYGIGTRLDQQPELLFQLRKVDHTALLATAGTGLALGDTGPAAGRVLADPGLAELFGIEMASPAKDAARAEPVKAKHDPSAGSATKKSSGKSSASSPGRRKAPAKKRTAARTAADATARLATRKTVASKPARKTGKPSQSSSIRPAKRSKASPR
jgi:uncharacterized Zn finger protein